MAIRVRKIVKYIFLSLLAVFLIFIGIFCNSAFPIITGYCAKSMCTEVFLAGRDPAAVSKIDLGFFPVLLGKCNINRKDSTVTATIFGFWTQQALFRNGIGSTLVHDISIDSLRKQAAGFYRVPAAGDDTAAWPMGDRVSDSFPAAVNKIKLDSAVNNFFAEDDPHAIKNTRALLIVYRGQIISERYADGFNQNSMFLGWSMGKSIGGALVGILNKQGRFKPDDPIALNQWIKERDEKRKAISIKNVLQQASGLHFEENYARASDVTVMLYKKTDMANFTAEHHLAHLPGRFFNYSSGNANLLSLKMRELLGDDVYHQFPYTALFNRIGMRHTLFEPDASGTFIMSSYTYASARDWARFGLLLLNKGMCNDVQILDSSWVEESSKPSATENFNHYGYQLWLNRGNDPAGTYRAFPHAPVDMVYAGGFQGQNVFIIPSRQLVVVRLGMSVKPDYHADHSLQLLLKAIE